jgi:putative ABC transport system permease protein
LIEVESGTELVIDLKFFPLVWDGFWRRPIRSVLTAICIGIAFVLLGLLEGVNAGFERAIENARRDVLAVQTRVRGGANMPISSIDDIRQVPGVRDVAQRYYFVGSHGDAVGLAAIATLPDIFFGFIPGLVVTQESLDAMSINRSGMLATTPMLDELGWEIGDTVTWRSDIQKTDGTGDWEFTILGEIATPQTNAPAFFAVINYGYLDEYRAQDRGTAEMFYVGIDDPTRARATSRAIDSIFANSSHETRTRSQQARAEQQANQMGDVKFLTNAVMGAVVFMLAILTGNTLRQSLQDRSREFALLKSVGYSDARLLSLAFAEALLLYIPPALIGLGIARLLAPMWRETFGNIYVSATVAAAGLLCAVCLALLGSALPAWSLSRTPAAHALRKG